MYGPRMEATFDRGKGGGPIDLVLGPPEDENSAAIISGFLSDDRVRAYMLVSYPVTRSREEDWLRRNNTDEDGVRWAVHAGGVLIGMIGLGAIDRANRKAELGILIGRKDYWGKGVATAAEVMVLEYGFANIVAGGLNKINARVLGDNHASAKALQNAGFAEIGTRRKDVWKNGRWHDVRLSEVLQEDWQTIRADRFAAAGLVRFSAYPGCEELGYSPVIE